MNFLTRKTVPGTTKEYPKDHNPSSRRDVLATVRNMGSKYVTTTFRGREVNTRAMGPYARTQGNVKHAVAKQFPKSSSFANAAKFTAKAAVVVLGVALALKGAEVLYNATDMPSISKAFESIRLSSIPESVSTFASDAYTLATDNSLTRGVSDAVSGTFNAVDQYLLPPVVSKSIKMVANTVLHPIESATGAIDMALDNPVARGIGYVGSGVYNIVDNPVTRFACNWTVVPAYDLTTFLVDGGLNLGWSATKGIANIGWSITKGTANFTWDNPVLNFGKSMVSGTASFIAETFVPPGLRNPFSSL
ncbi:hypothetical protein COB11_02470 [Candidatus Aerophobetes bacterium]|uniref:Uncharacterized protein n=1 Tax=Aerophobetes bacterium TaxID=2030807 RepID=A0A2A4YL70_UNCAE|nr:MAG: hypothetical protein COB11_02470 [Candidatus Aerophobetes bacterium]